MLRPFTFPPLELALLQDWDEKMRRLAERGAALPITMLGGVPSWLLVLFDRLRQATGKRAHRRGLAGPAPGHPRRHQVRSLPRTLPRT